MFEFLRKVFGPVAVTVIIGAIAMVFVFYGVFNPRGTGGGAQGAMAATVNGDSISMQEYAREYQRRTEVFQGIMKGKMDPNMLKQLHIGEQVVEDLIRRRLVAQAAENMGIAIGDAEIREKIKEMPYFKDKDGKFDVTCYRGLLDANRYSPSTFEGMVREDLLRERASDFIRSRAKVSSDEVKSEFLVTEDRRQVDYVSLTNETAKKFIVVGDKDIDELLAGKAGLDSVKRHYEQTKMLYAKPVAHHKNDKKKGAAAKKEEPPKPEFIPFDEVKRKVAADLLRERKGEEAYKINKELAGQLFEKAKSSMADFKALAKAKGLEVKTSQKFNRQQNFVPGVGEFPELVQDSFKEKSPLTQGPKLYEGRQSFAVVWNLAAFKPNLADLAKEQEKLAQTVTSRKAENMFQTWMSDLRSKAKVSINKQITAPDTEGDGGAVPAMAMPEED